MPEASQTSRAVGCFLGGAIGDALGAPIEFDKLAEIRGRFGADGLVDFPEQVGRITDDTQMALFTAEGLLNAHATNCDPVPAVHRAYLCWLATQGLSHPLLPEPDGWLVTQRELWWRRAPGNTCLSALSSAQLLGRPADNDSKGCGTVMRIAPVGLAHAPAQAFRLGAKLSALTHGHPTGILSGAFFAAVVSALVAERPLRAAIHETMPLLRAEERAEETLTAVDRALALAASGVEASAESVETLGGGWIAEEALGIALYAALRARDFRHGVLLAVNHSGDSDSTGSLTGNLMGAMWGIEAVPQEWLDRIELRATVETIARSLIELR